MVDHHEAHSLVESIRSSAYRPESPEERDRLLGLLAAAAASPDREARSLAAYRLGWLFADAGPVAEGMIKTLLLDADDHVRLKAAMTAMRASNRCKDDLACQLVPIFLDAANREEGLMRTQVLQCLGRFERSVNAILPTLIAALSSEDPQERYVASTSLRKFGTAASRAGGPIRQAVERETECLIRSSGVIDLQLDNAYTLFKVTGDDALARAVATEKSHDAKVPENVRRRARSLLEEINDPRRT